MHGTFIWNELATTDVERARAFYAETLDWVLEEFPLPDGPYWVARVGEQLVAGLCGVRIGAVPSQTSYWFPFIGVDDVDRCVEAALANGGTLVRPIEDVPNIGRVAVLRDPTGAVIGWMTPVTADAVASE